MDWAIVRIAGDRVDGDQGAFEAAAGGEFLEQQRDGGRFVGFVVDRLLSENQMAVGGEGGDQMQRGPSLGPVVAAAHGLAVDGDRVERLGPAGANPVHEAGGEQVRIDPVHHDVDPAPRGNAPVERQESPQKPEMVLSPIGDGLEAVAFGDRGADAQQAKSRSACEPRLPDFVCPRSGKSGPAEAATARVARVRKARRPSDRLRIRSPMDSAFPQLVNPR